MNLKDKCKEDGITLAEGKIKYGLTHWKQVVPESCDEIPEVAEDVVLEDVVTIETESKEDEVSMDDKIKSCRGLGTKSKYWKELNG